MHAVGDKEADTPLKYYIRSSAPASADWRIFGSSTWGI
jgi:hypothetical protein